MSLIKWDPAHNRATFPSEVFTLQKEMNKVFDNFFHFGLDEHGSIKTMWSPDADVLEEGDNYVVKLELPGLTKDDVKISIDSTALTVRGEKKLEKEAREKNYHSIERSYGSFQRFFTLPSTVKTDMIDAAFKNGILTITLPKAEESKSKQIDVKVK